MLVRKKHKCLACVHRIIGADLSFVTVGLSFTVAKGFSPLKRNAWSYLKAGCNPTPNLFIQVLHPSCHQTVSYGSETQGFCATLSLIWIFKMRFNTKNHFSVIQKFGKLMSSYIWTSLNSPQSSKIFAFNPQSQLKKSPAPCQTTGETCFSEKGPCIVLHLMPLLRKVQLILAILF